jgi:DNA-binding NarL/FixJ family response regulator
MCVGRATSGPAARANDEGCSLPVDVFLVEDQHHMQSVLSDLLMSLGDFRIVGSATTEAEALAWLDTHPNLWDLAVIDLVLDQGSGINVIERARKRGEHASVAVLSGYVSDGIRSHCLTLGADAAFQKGQEMPDFIAFCEGLADSQNYTL